MTLGLLSWTDQFKEVEVVMSFKYVKLVHPTM